MDEPSLAPWPASSADSGPELPAKAHRPQQLAWAVKLMYFGIALSLIAGVTTVLLADELRRTMRATTPEATDAEMAAALNVVLFTGVIFAGIFAFLWWLNAKYNSQGKRWARTLSTVLAGLNSAFYIYGLGGEEPAVSTFLNSVHFLLGVIVVTLLWTPSSREFYSQQP